MLPKRYKKRDHSGVTEVLIGLGTRGTAGHE
jgi:hypothetical protein